MVKAQVFPRHDKLQHKSFSGFSSDISLAVRFVFKCDLFDLIWLCRREDHLAEPGEVFGFCPGSQIDELQSGVSKGRVTAVVRILHLINKHHIANFTAISFSSQNLRKESKVRDSCIRIQGYQNEKQLRQLFLTSREVSKRQSGIAFG